MKTEDLVSLLSTRTEAVDLRLSPRRWSLALAGGALIVFLLTVELLKLIPAHRWWPDRRKTIPL